MSLQVVGAGLPRTGTASLGIALEKLLGGRRYHFAAPSTCLCPKFPFPRSTVEVSGQNDWTD